MSNDEQARGIVHNLQLLADKLGNEGRHLDSMIAAGGIQLIRAQQAALNPPQPAPPPPAEEPPKEQP